MDKKTIFRTAVSLMLLFGSLSLYPFNVGASIFTQDNENHEVLFSIPIGDDGIYYSGEGNPDMLTWGPAAITVAPRDSLWIADTAGNRLLQYGPDGTMLNKINIEDIVIGAGDLEVTSEEIWILDIASQPPKVVRLTLDGKVLNIYELPKGLHLENGLSGIALGENNALLVEREGGAHVVEFIAPDGAISQKPLNGYVFGGKLYAAQPADLTAKDTSRGYITAGDVRIEVSVTHSLGGLRILGVSSDGSFFVIVEELAVDTALRVDQTIRHYGSSGELLGMARIPLAEQHTYVAQGLAFGPDGEVYALITRPDHVEVQRLRFSKDLKPILTPSLPSDNEKNTGASGFAPLSCRSRDAIMSTASSYTNNSKYLDSYHINDPNNQCSGCQKPRYLGSAGTYSSVSYD